MHDSTHEQSHVEKMPLEVQRRGCTGPRSPEGKERSSGNALTHGCRSEKLIIRSEDPAAFDALREGWFQHYQPETDLAAALVEETVRAHWFLKRAQKHLEDVEWELPGNAYHWTEEHERLFRNFSRYKNAAERTFFRFFKELEAHFNRGTPSAEMKERARATAAGLDRPPVVKKEEDPPKPQPCPDPGAANRPVLPEIPTPPMRENPLKL